MPAFLNRFGVELLVIALGLIQCIGFVGTYILSVALDHVTPGFPYISDTGGKPPESCVFTFVCSVSAIISLLVMYIRYKHVHQYYQTLVARIGITNKIAFFTALVSVTGLIIVGSFQDDTVSIAHFIGAFMVFGGGIVYMWLQTLISYRIYHASLTRHHGSIVIAVRLVLAFLATVFFISNTVFMIIAGRMLHHNSNQDGGTFKWTSDDGGFPYHLTSTISEWCLAASFLLFLMSFHLEFVKIGVTVSVSFRSTASHQIQESTPLLL